MPQIRLSELKPGQKCSVHQILTTGSTLRRLLDIGLIENTEVECVGKSPFGDPHAFFIRGTTIAIRQLDSRNIIVMEKENAHG